MKKLVINGGTRLQGNVKISGAKNAAIAILPATLLIDGICTISNMPNISDVKLYIQILEKIGAKIKWEDKNKLTIDTRELNCKVDVTEITRKFRASYYILGALLGRCHYAQVGAPGGCKLGARPIDQHIKAFEALGATVNTDNCVITAKCNELNGNKIHLDVISVGATINTILASVLAKGTTIIENVAKEPHVVDVANFLNAMGAKIQGIGTNTIKITGVEKLKGNATYSVVPDQIEAGTFMLAAVATGGDITLTNCIPEHLEVLSNKIKEIGGNVEVAADTIRVWCNEKPECGSISTAPYPGFPTDLQSQFGVVFSISKGTSNITENIWESRFLYTQELNKMGANISYNGKVATFNGVSELHGASVNATDLRAGAALIIAGIVASGTTEIHNLEHIDRGYEDIEGKFMSLGAKISKVEETDK